MYKAVLTDFGKTMNVRRMKRTDVPQIPRSRNPPEVLITPFSKIDRFRADVYAMGCTLYGLVWGGLPPWAHSFDVRRLSEESDVSRRGLFDSISLQYKNLREEKVGHQIRKLKHGKAVTAYERFQILVMKMIDCDVHQRPLLRSVALTLNALIHGSGNPKPFLHVRDNMVDRSF